MELEFRPDQHLIRNSLFLHILNGPQAYIPGILVKWLVFLSYDTYVSAHGQRRNLCKRIHHSSFGVRYKYHITLFHRGVSIVRTIKTNPLRKNLFIQPFNRNGNVSPTAV